MTQRTNNNPVERPPVVVVMGHVDHGKTLLLDTIRKTNIAGKEAGGITQSIGAYEIVHNGKRITFIDTPGHEAFSKMRERGAEVADLAILVVAADDGVKAQTKEALAQILASKTPYIVAINKIDKPSANIDRAKRELLENGVLLEGLGGNISHHELSAKTGEGVSELLDLILIAAELEGLTYDKGVPAKGFIVEAKTDSQRGITASAVLRDGTLKKGDEIATPTASARVRIMENFLGKQVDEAEPSTPVLIVGFDSLPIIGEEFVFGATAAAPARTKITTPLEKRENTVSIIIRADSLGTLEALVELVKHVTKGDYVAQVVDAAVGEITNNDVNSAVASGAIIMAFNVGINKSSEQLAKDNKVTIISSPIIYKLMEYLEEVLEKDVPKPLIGEARILRIFKKVDNGFIVGGKVLTGSIKNGAIVELWRGENKVGEGTILNLQTGRKDVDVVEAGNEFGILFEGRNVFENDLIRHFQF